MKQSLNLKLGQHLTMTPQLQQAIRLLQMSSLELETEIQQALDSNLMLETPEDQPSPVDSTPDQREEKISNNDKEVNLESSDMPDELPVDSHWDDVFDNTPSAPAGAAPETDFEYQGTTEDTLRDHLVWQLELTPFTDVDRSIAAEIIDDIDDDGYFKGSIEEIAAGMPEEEEVDLAHVMSVLKRIQSFEPPGVGARNVQESLQIQLQQLNPDTPWRDIAIDMVNRHLALLGKHDFDGLRRVLRISKDDLQEVILLVQSLKPRPGSEMNISRPEYIIPDVFVEKRNGKWHVELNRDAMPKVRINSYYASLIKRADNSDDNTTLKNHLQEARWFLKSLQSRSETLFKVASAIVEKQTNFLEYGPEAMRPMVLHDIAAIVEMHESTVSRVTSRKYMHTPRGIFELKFFFSSHVDTEAGGEASSTAIRALIKKLVQAENPCKPLSDNKIATILSNEGIKVARRTVAKYREAMVIPSSTDRKRLG